MVLAALTFALNVLTVVVGAVWIASKIQGTTERLAVSIDHLAINLDRQQNWLNVLEDKVQNHGERLAVVEMQSTAMVELARTTTEIMNHLRALHTSPKEES